LEIGAFAVFLSWIVLLLFIQKLPKLGIFVVMFTDVLKTFLEFFIVLLLFTLGFALAFHILFGNRVSGFGVCVSIIFFVMLGMVK